jgi:hypothetical protein
MHLYLCKPNVEQFVVVGHGGGKAAYVTRVWWRGSDP